jgi:hypothetical protein
MPWLAFLAETADESEVMLLWGRIHYEIVTGFYGKEKAFQKFDEHCGFSSEPSTTCTRYKSCECYGRDLSPRLLSEVV